MPRFRVEYFNKDGIEMHTIVTAENRDHAADKVMNEEDADCIEHVEEIG
jgi:hypothetical protein